MHPLFRSPLRYDALTWLWVLLLAGAFVLHLRVDTWVSAWAFALAGTLVSSAFVLIVALVRFLVDGPQLRVKGARTMREVLGIDVLPGVGDWDLADGEPPAPEPAAEPEPGAEPEPVAEPAPVAAPLERPRAYRIEVSEVRVTEGSPVTVTWSFEGADSVVVDGRTGFPSHGQTTVALRHTRAVVLIGANAAGVTAVTTPEVEVAAQRAPVPPPGPRPLPPLQRLQVDLRGSANGAESVLGHLDRVMAAQDRMRPYQEVRLTPIGVPASFTRWLRGHPQQPFVGQDATLDALQPGPGPADAPGARRARVRTRRRADTDTDRTDS